MQGMKRRWGLRLFRCHLNNLGNIQENSGECF